MKWLCAIAIVFVCAPMLFAQSTTHVEAPAVISDSTKQGLRGPVKSVTESATISHPNPDGSTTESTYGTTTEYDRAGLITEQSHHNPDGSVWSTRYEYNAAGQLLKIRSGTEGKPQSETDYTYDAQGRLQKITGGDNTPPTSFRYDEHGRKTMVVTHLAEDYRPNVATGGSPFEGAQFTNLPGGGTSTTIYDEHDRPTEIQTRDAKGHLVSHSIRRYDSDGRVSEEKQFQDDFMAMFPPDAKTQLLEQSGLSSDQLRQALESQIKQFMKDQPDLHSISYRYDLQGRPTHTSRRVFNLEDEIDTAYNDHGDIASEITRSTRPPDDLSKSGPSIDSYSEVRYSYGYDSHGNWTQKTTSYRSAPDSGFEPSAVVNRSITYY